LVISFLLRFNNGIKPDFVEKEKSFFTKKLKFFSPHSQGAALNAPHD